MHEKLELCLNWFVNKHSSPCAPSSFQEDLELVLRKSGMEEWKEWYKCFKRLFGEGWWPFRTEVKVYGLAPGQSSGDLIAGTIDLVMRKEVK
ncbi:hypothetical protein TrCOL_g1479 [Triparma columacea]|uniref:Uncharacterized protein n=1 Tax=Triparma columacea TaxID=722753 RepID=A0A9W7L8H1_9STRA|nr:hypothetical protein TrCOL_g1479 [Triparma columacea]